MILSGNRRSLLWSMLGGVLVAGLVLVAFTRTRDPAPKVAGDDQHIAGGDPRATTAPVTRPAADDAAAQALQEVLDKRLQELRFDGIALSDVIDFMRDVSGAKIAVNWKTIEAAGVEKTAPVTVRLRDIKFSKALGTILSDVGGGKVKLGYTIDDGVITISTADDIEMNTLINVYDIRDLLADRSNVAKLRNAPAGVKGEPIEYDEQLVRDISNLIRETVDRESWVENGGRVGQLRFLSGQLIVTQNRENHRQIVALLDKLRESMAIQVSIEMRFIGLRRGQLADIARNAGLELNVADKVGPLAGTTPPTTQPGVFVDDAKFKAVLAAVQAAKDATVLTAPRMTMFNGQAGTVTVGTERAHISGYRAGKPGEEKWVPVTATVNDGINVEVQPTVSADRKSITVKLHPRVAEFRKMREEPWDKAPAGEKLMVQKPEMDVQEINSVVSVADGQTLMIVLPKAAGKKAETDMVTLFTARPTIVIQREVEPLPPAKP